jgi:hypothetical protein
MLDRAPERRYASLLEVALSVWHRMCHAYTRPDTKNVVTSLYCFAPNGERAHYVWLNIDVSALASVSIHERPKSSWISIVDTSYVQAVYDKQNITRPSGARTTAELVQSGRIKKWSIDIELNPGNVCRLTLPEGPGSKNTFQWMPNTTMTSVLVPNLRFIRTSEVPFVEIVGGDVSDNYFLLITMDERYSVFYRNRRLNGGAEAELMAYPLLFHPEPPSPAPTKIIESVKKAYAPTLVRSPREFLGE